MKGGAEIQPEDAMTMWLNDTRNYPLLREQREDIDPKDYMCNRVPQYFPIAVQKIFRVESEFVWGCHFDDLKKRVTVGQACVVLLKNPGHFITIKAYDEDTNELLYDDPWSENPWPSRSKGTSSFNRRLIEQDFSNIDSFKIVFYP